MCESYVWIHKFLQYLIQQNFKKDLIKDYIRTVLLFKIHIKLLFVLLESAHGWNDKLHKSMNLYIHIVDLSDLLKNITRPTCIHI